MLESCLRSNLLNTGSHQTVDVELVVAGRLEEFLVACQIVVEDRSVVHHATQAVVDDRHFHAVRQHLEGLPVDSVLDELLEGWRDQKVAPVQVAMLELELPFSDSKSQCSLCGGRRERRSATDNESCAIVLLSMDTRHRTHNTKQMKTKSNQLAVDCGGGQLHW